MMSDDINRLLADACEDRSIRIPVDDVVRRGRRRVRARRGGGAAFSMLAVGGVLAAVAAWPNGASPAGPDADPPVADSQPGPAAVGDDEVIQRCLELDDQFTTHSGNKASGGTDPIVDWSVAVTQADGTWTRAILVSPDEKRFAYCLSDERGVGHGDYYREAVDLGPGFDAWVGDHGAQGTAPDSVARLTFETVDGAVTEATIVDGFYLWYAEKTDWGGDPVWATYYDADGNVLERVNANPASSLADPPVGDVGGDVGCDDWRIEDRPTAEHRSDQLVTCRGDVPARAVGAEAGCDDWRVEDRPMTDGRSDQLVICRGDAG